jgi:anaerobic ribonucleoside-triphosphate reductase activating protein
MSLLQGCADVRCHEDIVRLHRFLKSTAVEGPGVRACIWVQGCSIRCPGCAVPWTWHTDGGAEISVAELFDQVMACPGIEGVTFVGGEPFEQARSLAVLGARLRRENLSVVTFTGLTLSLIRSSQRADWDALLGVTDLLIDGPYVAALSDQSRPWVGSKNQGFHFLTPRYRNLEKTLGQVHNRLEVHVSPTGVVRANGMLPVPVLAQLFNGTGLTIEGFHGTT